MNAAVPKQFLPLAGIPVAMHSLVAFSSANPEISLILVLPGDQFGNWQDLCTKYAFSLPHLLVAGGETRFHSVRNALALLPAEGLIAVHDAARPLVSEILIQRVFQAAELWGNAIPVIPINESVRQVTGENSSPIDRHTLRIVQTPQVFHASLLLEAYRQEFKSSFTDDATVVECMDETIHLVDGEPANFKITYPHDLAIAEKLFEKHC